MRLLNRRNQRGLRVALWMLLLLAGNALQVVAATHCHSTAIAAVGTSGAQPHGPLQDGIDHDGCLLCQAAAHLGGGASPPASWALANALESRTASPPAAQRGIVTPRPSHSWQGRAPPRV
jgi:hypothetical protein